MMIKMIFLTNFAPQRYLLGSVFCSFIVKKNKKNYKIQFFTNLNGKINK